MPVEYWTDPDNDSEWVSHSLMSRGDYDGSSGDIELANIRAAVKEFGDDATWIHHGPHHHEQCWILLSAPGAEDWCKGLDNYPIMDDEIHSAVQVELEEEAWDSWIRRELDSGLTDTVCDVIDTIPEGQPLPFGPTGPTLDDVCWQAYRDAMESENEYPAFEGNGCYVRVKAIQESYGFHLMAQLLQHTSAIPIHPGTEAAPFDVEAETDTLVLFVHWSDAAGRPGRWTFTSAASAPQLLDYLLSTRQYRTDYPARVCVWSETDSGALAMDELATFNPPGSGPLEEWQEALEERVTEAYRRLVTVALGNVIQCQDDQ